MTKWRLCFVLLLPLIVCIDSEVTLVKTLGRKPDVTPICTNETLDNITIIVCKIRTDRNGGEECRLLYRRRRGFEHECDSRFTLMTENQTVFLHLTSLTPVDSGSYTCECSHPGGTYIIHLNITVEEDEDASSSALMLSGVTVVIITGIILGLIYKRLHHRRQPEPPRSPPNMEPQDIEPYSIFTQRRSGLYSTVRVHVCNTNSDVLTTGDTHAGHFL